MDVTPEVDELTDLRARAYGPDADIHDDPVARARLHQLEESLRGSAIPDAATEPDAEPTPDHSAPVSDTGEMPSPSTARKRQRVPVWAWVLVGVLAMVAAIVISAFLPGRPDATLHVVSDSEAIDIEPTGMLDWYQITPDAMRRYDDFAEIQVWSGLSRSGSQCLVLIYFGNVANASCAPTDLDPIADFIVYDGARAVGGLELPVGSVIRFHQRGETIDVTVGRAAPQQAVPFEDPFSGS